MKKLLRIILLFLGFLLFASLILYVAGYGYIFKGIATTYLTGHKTAFIDDYPYFDNHVSKNLIAFRNGLYTKITMKL